MEQRAYSKKCSTCRQRTVELQDIEYSVQIAHDGRQYDIRIPSLSVPKCLNCGAFTIDAHAERKISNAFHEATGLLRPEEIRDARLALGYTLEALADQLALPVATLSRWEDGMQIQPRSQDRTLRAFFDVPAFREYLHGVSNAVNTLATTPT